MSPVASILLSMRLLEPAAAPTAPEPPRTTVPADAVGQAPPTLLTAEPEPVHETWDGVFAVPVVESHLHASEVRAVVVPAGDHPQTEDAARALEGALGASLQVTRARRAKAVMLRDNAKIARRVGEKGYDRILVVRVFDVEQRVQAMVDVLDAEGHSLDAFLAWSDEPVVTTDTASRGVSEAALEAIMSSDDGPESIEPTQPVVYDPKRRAFHRGHINPATELEGSEFYEYVGRDDLARAHRTRVGVGWSLFAAGGAVTIFGNAASLVFGDAGNTRRRALIIVNSLGALAIGSGLTLSLSTPSRLEARIRMARVHNRKLGVHPEGPELSLRPAVGAHHAGLVLGGRF